MPEWGHAPGPRPAWRPCRPSQCPRRCGPRAAMLLDDRAHRAAPAPLAVGVPEWPSGVSQWSFFDRESRQDSIGRWSAPAPGRRPADARDAGAGPGASDAGLTAACVPDRHHSRARSGPDAGRSFVTSATRTRRCATGKSDRTVVLSTTRAAVSTPAGPPQPWDTTTALAHTTRGRRCRVLLDMHELRAPMPTINHLAYPHASP